MRTSPDMFENNSKDIESLFDIIDSNEEVGAINDINKHNNEGEQIVLLEYNKNESLEPLDNSG